MDWVNRNIENERLRWLAKMAMVLNARFKARTPQHLPQKKKRSKRAWYEQRRSKRAAWADIVYGGEPGVAVEEEIALRKAGVDRARESVAVDMDDPNRNHVIPLDVKVPSRLNYLQLDDNPSHDNMTKVYEDHAGFFE